MTVFETLFLSHVVGDWLLQTEWQAINKKTSWPALLTHILIYHALMLIVLLAYLHLPALPSVVAVVVLAIFHTILDRQAVVQWTMKTLRLVVTREPERWLHVAIDQSLHLVSLGIVAHFLIQAANR